MSPALNGISVIRCFRHIKIHNGIIFIFYTGLPQALLNPSTQFTHAVYDCWFLLAMCVWYVHPHMIKQLLFILPRIIKCTRFPHFLYCKQRKAGLGPGNEAMLLSRSRLQLCIFFTSRNEATTEHSNLQSSNQHPWLPSLSPLFFRSFVIEKQPPQVIKTANRFSATVRLDP